MLTPLFELKQDGEFVVISAKCPYIKVSQSAIAAYVLQFKWRYRTHFHWGLLLLCVV